MPPLGQTQLRVGFKIHYFLGVVFFSVMVAEDVSILQVTNAKSNHFRLFFNL